MGNRTAGLRDSVGLGLRAKSKSSSRPNGKPQNRLVANQLPLHVNKRRVERGGGGKEEEWRLCKIKCAQCETLNMQMHSHSASLLPLPLPLPFPSNPKNVHFYFFFNLARTQKRKNEGKRDIEACTADKCAPFPFPFPLQLLLLLLHNWHCQCRPRPRPSSRKSFNFSWCEIFTAFPLHCHPAPMGSRVRRMHLHFNCKWKQLSKLVKILKRCDAIRGDTRRYMGAFYAQPPICNGSSAKKLQSPAATAAGRACK